LHRSLKGDCLRLAGQWYREDDQRSKWRRTPRLRGMKKVPRRCRQTQSCDIREAIEKRCWSLISAHTRHGYFRSAIWAQSRPSFAYAQGVATSSTTKISRKRCPRINPFTHLVCLSSARICNSRPSNSSPQFTCRRSANCKREDPTNLVAIHSEV